MDSRWLGLQGITAADLELNRTGRLAEVQAERVRAENATRKKLMLVGALIGMVGAFAILGLAGDVDALWIVIPIVVVMDALFLGILLAIFRQREREVEAGTVTRREATLGAIWLVPSRNRMVARIDRFPYTGLQMAELGKELKEGDRVILYTLPRSRAIVAVERA